MEVEISIVWEFKYQILLNQAIKCCQHDCWLSNQFEQ